MRSLFLLSVLLILSVEATKEKDQYHYLTKFTRFLSPKHFSSDDDEVAIHKNRAIKFLGRRNTDASETETELDLSPSDLSFECRPCKAGSNSKELVCQTESTSCIAMNSGACPLNTIDCSSYLSSNPDWPSNLE